MAGKVMTKSQLVSLLADKLSVTKSAANEYVELFAATAVAETKKNGQFVIPGIGKLVLVNRKARVGRNPKTGQEIEITPRRVVSFRPSMIFKEHVIESPTTTAE